MSLCFFIDALVPNNISLVFFILIVTCKSITITPLSYIEEILLDYVLKS